MDRRRFLQLGTAAAAAIAFDPERLLWVPGQKTIFLPSQTVVAAETMAEALGRGLIARVPDGHGGWADLELHFTGTGPTLDAKLRAEVAAITAMGGRVVERRAYTAHTLKDDRCT